jgi:hypothetical protein
MEAVACALNLTTRRLQPMTPAQLAAMAKIIKPDLAL